MCLLRSVAIGEAQQAAQPFPATDRPGAVVRRLRWKEQEVPFSLMRAFLVIMHEVLSNGVPQRCFPEKDEL